MHRSEIVYTSSYQPSPVSFWVHRALDSPVWLTATKFDPPLPKPVPGEGWARLEVEFDGVHLQFSSALEIEHVIDVLAQNPLPTTTKLARLRSQDHGPNSHWLSRLPGKAKSHKFRRRLVRYLQSCLPAYRQVA